MIFAKKNKNKYIKLAGAAAVLLAAASAMVWFTGCALTGQTENPADSAVSVSQTTNGKEDPYKRFDAVVKRVDGNIKKIEIGRKDDREPSEYVLRDKYVYYLYRETKEYILKRINTADPSDCGMVHIYCETDFFCSLSECALRIEKNDEVVFMDLDLNTICTVPNIEQYESIFPYKDSYVVMKGADLLIVNIVNSGSSDTSDAICLKADRKNIPVIFFTLFAKRPQFFPSDKTMPRGNPRGTAFIRRWTPWPYASAEPSSTMCILNFTLTPWPRLIVGVYSPTSRSASSSSSCPRSTLTPRFASIAASMSLMPTEP